MKSSASNDQKSRRAASKSITSMKQTGSMPEVAYQEIKRMILGSRLSAGQKLLYADLSRSLNMSKTPVISALSRLESEGYVSLKQNRGYYVKEFDPKEIAELMQAREIMEVANIDAVMGNLTDADLLKLEEIQKEYVKYYTDFYDEKKVALNTRFHLELARIGKNRFLLRGIENLYEWMHMRSRFYMLPPQRVKESAEEHAQMIHAMRERKKALVKRILRKHIRKPTRILLEDIHALELLSIWR